MALYRKHGVNPMGDVLPMLAQIPIFIALYNAPVRLCGNVAGALSVDSGPDTARLTFRLHTLGGYTLNLLALLMGVSMWVQQKMSPTTRDPPASPDDALTMPIIFTFMFWSFPSGWCCIGW